MLDPKSERAVADITAELRSLYGAHLVAVALYGSGAGPDFVPGVSDLNLVVVLDELGFDQLQALRTRVGAWHQHRLATPLVIDRGFLRDAADVFPMELHDIKERHRLLFGENVFVALPVHSHHLRYQCEHEARGKLLRLQQLYLEMNTSPALLQALLLDSLKTFLIIMRNMVRLRGLAGGGSYEAVLQAFSQHFGVEFPVMARLLHVRLGKEPWSGDAEAAFGAYRDELQRLVGLIDQLPAVSDAADAIASR